MFVFDAISLLGGLAMFLYGMRMMSASLKEGSSGTLKVAMEKMTNNPIKAFVLGVAVTAIIQSSTATIVITSGLVAAGIISLDQSLGIIIGANVGTTVTGQIIRLLDISGNSNPVLKFFQPSTLAPLALIFGIALIMFFKFKHSERIGSISMGFGILFSGLLNMTGAVSSLKDTGVFDALFEQLGNNPFLAYAIGAGVAFVLQSSSATIGILQAFSLAGDIPFKAVYVVLVGIYLGDCVTTAIVCSIGAKNDAKRVGIVNILFNLSETVLVLVVVGIIHKLGLIDNLWDASMTSGSIANTNTIFNLSCAVLLLPMVNIYVKLSRVLIKDKPMAEIKSKYEDKISALNPVFFSTPALAFHSSYEVLITMLNASCDNIRKAFGNISEYDKNVKAEIDAEEDNIDKLTDCVDNYLVNLSPYVSEELHVRILSQYHKMVTEFERIGDHAVNISDAAETMNKENYRFSEQAQDELAQCYRLLEEILKYARKAFEKRDIEAALEIEPLEEVMDELINQFHDNHLKRLRKGTCSIRAGMIFMDILSNIERISDICSNVGLAIIARVNPDDAGLSHNYVSSLHNREEFNTKYEKYHKIYFSNVREE